MRGYIFSHFSNTKIDLSTLVDTAQPKNGTFKPRGLWISVDGEGDWPEWCEAEDFCNTDDQYRHAVVLTESARILHLANSEEVDSFDKLYHGSDSLLEIDWFAVAKKYDGIIIAPYSRMHYSSYASLWHSAWDCSSGCIWNKSAIESIEIIATPAKGIKC